MVGGAYFDEFSKRRIIYLWKTYFDIQQKLPPVRIDLNTSRYNIINVTEHTVMTDRFLMYGIRSNDLRV